MLDCYRDFSPGWATSAAAFFERRLRRRPAAARQARRRLLRVHGALRAPVRDAQLHRRAAGRAGRGARARPRRPRRARGRQGIFHFIDAADPRRDRARLRRGDHVRAPAGGTPDPAGRLSLLADSLDGAVAAIFRQIAMNRFEDRVHRPGASRASCRSTPSPSAWRRPRPTCSATRSSSTTTTASGGPTSRTSSTRPATSTPTPTATCWRCRSTAATRRRAPASPTPTSSCCAPAARARPRSWGGSSASTSPTRASGPRARPRRAQPRPGRGRGSRGRPGPGRPERRERHVQLARGRLAQAQALQPVALVGRVDGVLRQYEAADDRGDAALGEHRKQRQRAAKSHERRRRPAGAL